LILNQGIEHEVSRTRHDLQPLCTEHLDGGAVDSA
jgi:hypothetical protein